MRALLLIVGVLVGFAAGLATGILTSRDGAVAVPSEVHEACTMFMTAYGDAQADADELNAAEDQSELAHPWRVSDVWSPTHMVALTEAVETIRWDEHAEDAEDEWWGVRRALYDALLVMGGADEFGAIDQVQALSSTQAVCIGR